MFFLDKFIKVKYTVYIFFTEAVCLYFSSLNAFSFPYLSLCPPAHTHSLTHTRSHTLPQAHSNRTGVGY